ncbi:hypothetical protein AAVH_20090 [Aphelenchoides avenae]|nr:hypothetical protein AAVH_20090 [Aphelenchus avenae]
MTALVRPNEVLSKARCDVCDHRCTFDFIQCDECEAWCHYACAEMTPKLAASSGKWYCRRCLRKEDAEKGRHSVVGQLKRQARSAGADYTQKKTRLDVASSGFDAEPPLELDLEDELDIESKREDELELYLSDASELDLDLDDDADLETARNDERELELYLSDASELELDLEEEPELKREDYVELVLDLDDEPELEMKREDDNELVLDLGEDLEDESLKKEPCSWT